MPMLYNTRYSSRRRVTVMISVVWVLSFAISCPLLFGLNNTGKQVLSSTLAHYAQYLLVVDGELISLVKTNFSMSNAITFLVVPIWLLTQLA
jgi:hypothetical protein